ncbi:hypothetical protein ZIOFF_057298 [Zingiber officinale]|uniref:Cell number regulator 6 n=2 Tax=Zingiber officinale TaxID=94328 RepID=A0A8J5F345_ZINOF|nr:hypothetical protein ZIOFF_057298 [Zingiber officinale]
MRDTSVTEEGIQRFLRRKRSRNPIWPFFLYENCHLAISASLNRRRECDLRRRSARSRNPLVAFPCKQSLAMQRKNTIELFSRHFSLSVAGDHPLRPKSKPSSSHISGSYAGATPRFVGVRQFPRSQFLSPERHLVPVLSLKMSDEPVSSRYVKLTKDQDAPLEEILPGELNQPVHVPQLEVRRCIECGQPLPESYEPPADEAWTTGICGCSEDPESCWTGLLCPCVLFGHNVETLYEDIPWTSPCTCHAICVEGGILLGAATALFHGIDPKTSFLIGEGLVFSWWMCGVYTGIFRQSLQKKYHLKDSPCDSCMVHCCMHWCAICQEHREMKGHLSDSIAPMTVVNPPPVQEMSTSISGVPETAPQHNQHAENSNKSIIVQ